MQYATEASTDVLSEGGEIGPAVAGITVGSIGICLATGSQARNKYSHTYVIRSDVASRHTPCLR